MEIRSLYLLSYFFSIAFVMAWLARLGLDFYHWSRKAGLYRLLAGQRISLKPLRDKLPWNVLLLSVSGLLFGWVVISWIEAWFVREWLLLILPALAILCIELLLTKKDISLLAVLALIAGLRGQREAGQDFFERLIKVVDGLPPGEIQTACRESIQRRRSGLPVDQSCQALSGLHPILNELVFTLRLTGWQASPAFDLSLERLAQRAGKQWDRLSRWMVFREQVQPILLFSQMAILAALLYLVVEGIPAFTLAWPSYDVIAWIGLGCILAAGMLYATHYRTWLRRLVGSALLIASFVPLWQYASLPRLFELQLHSATQISERIQAKQTGWEAIQAPTAKPKFLDTVPEEQDNTLLSTDTPAYQSMVDLRAQPSSISSQNYADDHSWTIPCYQPR
ncbi:MAG TPA: hypothetical protein VN363_09625 [Anaerolineales bacterium]|nr:hypothetical protein [Anaerolineales bacterium]